ncbi:unnamed protein product [Brassica oleracea var. botrytis]|uniref:(rape) hypothetical protein n=1 Tax=Brassica napus TaxID=3708 RepID=A0A816KEP6_BRANA|nr:unnamed protein product [Brassica napus]
MASRVVCVRTRSKLVSSGFCCVFCLYIHISGGISIQAVRWRKLVGEKDTSKKCYSHVLVAISQNS